jgi:DNA-binding CsgD family transcriptional regulator/tetratricopeptide (TPR) repeat protein
VLAQLRCGQFRQASELAEELLALGSDDERATALTAFGMVAWHQGRVADALSLLRAAADSARRHRPPGAIRAHLALAAVQIALGELSGAAACLVDAGNLSSERGALWEAGIPAISARHLLACGRISEAAECAAWAVDTGRQDPLREFVATGESVLAAIGLRLGDLRGAQEHVRRFEEEPPTIDGAFGLVEHRVTAALVVAAKERPAQAFETSVLLCDDPVAQRAMFAMVPVAPAFLVRTALSVGEHHRAEAVVAGAELLARENDDFPTVVAGELQARGLLEDDPSLLRQAIDAHRHPWARASATEDLASVLARSDPAAARNAYGLAIEGYAAVGAEHDAERVCDRLRMHATQSRARQRPRPLEGWASLTDTELKISDLVAQGLTNREAAGRLFVSRNTVDFHLRSIYRKMNVRSRVQLAVLSQDRPRWL